MPTLTPTTATDLFRREPDRYLDVGAGEVAHRQVGSGPDVLFVPGGTAGKVKMPDMEVAAKTGTAQTVDNGQKSNNSWVISFAPYENPKYAVCVLVQNAGSGGAVCGPLVNLLYHGLFSREKGIRLPLKPQTEFAGHTERIEAIELPAEALAAYFPMVGPPAPGDEIGETGEEAGVIAAAPVAEPVNDAEAPTPTLSIEIDDEGTVIPRAIPVPNP